MTIGFRNGQMVTVRRDGTGTRWGKRLVGAGKAIYKGLAKSSSSSSVRRTKKRRTVSKGRRPKSNVIKGFVTPDGTGGTRSKTVFASKKNKFLHKLLKKALPDCYDRKILGDRVTASIGTQAVHVSEWMRDSTFAHAFTNAGAVNYTDILLRSFSACIQMVNMDKGNVDLIIYDIVPRRDLSTSHNPATDFDSGLSNTSHGAGSATTAGSNNLYVTPFDSTIFARNHKIIKVTKVTLSQGGMHKHSIFRKLDKRWNLGVNNEQNYFRDLTGFTMVVAVGQPGNDENTKTLVSTCNVAIDVIQSTALNYAWLQNDFPAYQFDATNLGTIVTMNVMDKGSGEAEADAQA